MFGVRYDLHIQKLQKLLVKGTSSKQALWIFQNFGGVDPLIDRANQWRASELRILNRFQACFNKSFRS